MSMEKTPMAMRKHVALFGGTNVGKSSIFNALLGQDTAIVSEVSGTTTDPVSKPMELIPYGPITLIDTAGLGDNTELGGARVKKTKQVLSRTDLILQVMDINSELEVEQISPSIPTILVFTKCDIAYRQRVREFREKYPDAVFWSKGSAEDLEQLKARMTEMLQKQERDDDTLIGGLQPAGSNVLLVVPIDSAAPKGRLILPQVQLLRDCLDHNIRTTVVRETMLEQALAELPDFDLVVTDSQVFRMVSKIVPETIPLTSFSMLLAHQKGNFSQLLQGAETIAALKDGDKILMLEGCTHNATHEDIGRVKIPNLLRKKTGRELVFEYMAGYDFPDTVEEYALAIQCGMCMVNRREVQSRLHILAQHKVPVSNYGVVLAYLNGILARASEIFRRQR